MRRLRALLFLTLSLPLIVTFACSSKTEYPGIPSGPYSGGGNGGGISGGGGGTTPGACTKLGGMCVAIGDQCPRQVSGDNLCGSTVDNDATFSGQICCTGYDDAGAPDVFFQEDVVRPHG